MAKAVIIKASGTKELVEFEVGQSYELLSGAVGGYVEVVALPTRRADLWLNEEGKLNNLPYNPIATSLFHDEHHTGDFIVGNVIITGGVDDEGETLGLDDEQVTALMGYDQKLWTLGAFNRDSFF